MHHLRVLALSLAAATIAACSFGTLGPLTGKERILGASVYDTILIVEEDFEHDGMLLPQGVYYPQSGFSDGLVNYIFPTPLRVTNFFGRTYECRGGVRVSANEPYKDYWFFHYNCPDPATNHEMPQRLKFRIKVLDRPGVQLPRT